MLLLKVRDQAREGTLDPATPAILSFILGLWPLSLQLIEKPTAGPAVPRKGSLRAQRQRVVPMRFQAVATAPLTHSPSTSGREERPGPGCLPTKSVTRSVTEDPLPSSSSREFRFTSEVPICLDYHGKHVTVDQVVSGAIRQAV